MAELYNAMTGDTRNSFWTKTNNIVKFGILDEKVKFTILDQI